MRYRLTLTEIAVVRKIVPVFDEDMEKLEPHVLLIRPLSGAAALENNLLMSLKVKHGVSIWSVILVLGICLGELKHYVHTKTSTQMFMAA